MTAIPTFALENMNHLLVDDSMDLAPSPAMPTEDFDFELDPMREASAEPNQDIMIEDDPDQHHPDTELMQSGNEGGAPDDDMLDEDIHVQDLQPTSEVIDIESRQHDLGATDEDEDILYEDEVDGENAIAEDKPTQDVDIENGEDFLHEGVTAQESKDDNISHTEEYEGEHIEEEDMFHGEAVDANQNIDDTQGDQETGLYDPSADPTHTTENVALDEQSHSRHPAAPDSVGLVTGATELTEVSTGIEDALQSPLPLTTDEGLSATSNFDTSTNISASANDASADLDSKDDERLPISVDQTYNEAHNSSKPVEEDDRNVKKQQTSSLHTIKVNYQDNEICLFPPAAGDNSETFFLPEVSLAYESLDKLLKACREILTGTIGDDDELVLDVASLGLHISEGSSYACQLTFSQILDVYLTLCHNDQAEHIDPLYCTLTSRVSLASQYAYLVNAAQSRKTFAEISLEHMGSVDGSGNEFEGDATAEAGLHSDRPEPSHDKEQEGVDEDDTKYDVQGASQIDAQVNIQADDFNDASSNAAEPLELQIENAGSENGTDDAHLGEDDADANEEYDAFENSGRSPTSTVRGDENEPADIYPDDEEYHEQLSSTSPPADTSEPDADGESRPWDGKETKVENASANIETESSRTLEPETEPYEHPFSDQNHTDFAQEQQAVMTHEEGHDHDSYLFGENTADSGFDEELAYHRTTDSFDDELYSDGGSHEVLSDGGSEGEEDYLLDFLPVDHDDSSGDPDPDHLPSEGSANSQPLNHHQDISGLGLNHDATAEETTSQVNGHGKLQDDVSRPELAHEDDRFAENKVTPPATPGPKSSKRKALDDEEDFGLLDPATPDFKRRRPS